MFRGVQVLNKFNFVFLAVFVLLAGIPISSQAQFTWSGGGANATWNASSGPFVTLYTNWGNSISLPNSGSTVTFGSGFGSGNPNLNGNRAVAGVIIATGSTISIIGAPSVLTVGALGFSRAAQSSGTQTIAVPVANAGMNWTIDGAGSLIFNQPISGVAMTKNGAGSLVFQGNANTFSGTTTVAGGSLVLSKTSGNAPFFGSAIPGDLVINAGAVAEITSSHQISNNSKVTVSGALKVDGVEDIRVLILSGGNLTGTAPIGFTGEAPQLEVNQSGQINCPINLNASNSSNPTDIRINQGQLLSTTAFLTDGNSQPGRLKITGGGILRLNAASSYSGGTTIELGTLHVSNASGSATGSGAVTVETGSQIIGDGRIGGLTTFETGSKLSPGNNNKATITFNGGLIAEDNVTVDLEIGDGQSDRVNISGATLVQQGVMNINLIKQGSLTPGQTYTLADWSGVANSDGIDPNNIFVNTSIIGNFFVENSQLKFTVLSTPVYVNALATGANNGTSWQDAYTSLQTAITSTTGAVDIFVAAGTYRPSTNNQSVFFELRNGLRLYGGFPNTGNPTIAQRNPAANPTILSGANYSRHVLRASGTDATTTIDGFIVQQGSAGGAPQNQENLGGGIIIQNSSPVIVNTIFRNNFALVGGAVYISGGSPVFINCLFHNNSATVGGASGGGLYITGGTLKMVNCTVANNNAGTGGGVVAYATTQLFNTIIWGNTAASSPNLGGFSNNFNIQYSNIQGGWSGTGNTNIDPQFLDPGNGDYRLASASPAAGAGNNALLMSDVSDSDFDLDTGEQTPLDLAFNTRIIQGTVDQGPYEIQNPQPALATPANLTAQAVSATQINLNWDDNQEPSLTGYHVYRSTVAGFTPSIENRVATNVPASQHSDTGLINGITYYYRVTAVSAGGQSLPSNEASAQTVSVPEIIYVKASANPGGDGTSWTLAYKDLQLALVRAGVDDQIWVAEGSYIPTPPPHDFNFSRAQSFFLKAHVSILGGFPGLPGQEGNLSVRDYRTYASVLTGNIADPNNPFDNSLHVVQTNGNDTGAVLDGLVITGGQAGGLVATQDNVGAGLRMYNSSAVIRNCIIEGNNALAGAGAFVSGGSPAFINTIFRNNSANSGGAAGAGVYNQASNARFYGCLFYGNSAQTGAGAYNENGGLPTYINCTFANNTVSVRGGGMWHGFSGNSVIANSIFWGNTSSQIAPQLGISDSSSVTIRNSIVQGGYDEGAYSNIINQNPLFIDPAGGNFRVSSTSPAYNAGVNADVPSLLTRDLSGFSRILYGTVDLGAFEMVAPVGSIAAVKLDPDNAPVLLGGKVVTMTAANYFYIQDDNRASGIRVELNNHTAVKGARVNVEGMMSTNAAGERYIIAAAVVDAGNPSNAVPMHATGDAIGGGNLTSVNTGGGQVGPTGGVGLNNVGLLVKTTGRVTQVNVVQGWITIDDGSRTNSGPITDADGHNGIRVYLNGTVPLLLLVGSMVEVEGPVSLMKTTDTYAVIRLQSPASLTIH